MAPEEQLPTSFRLLWLPGLLGLCLNHDILFSSFSWLSSFCLYTKTLVIGFRIHPECNMASRLDTLTTAPSNSWEKQPQRRWVYLGLKFRVIQSGREVMAGEAMGQPPLGSRGWMVLLSQLSSFPFILRSQPLGRGDAVPGYSGSSFPNYMCGNIVTETLRGDSNSSQVVNEG